MNILTHNRRSIFMKEKLKQPLQSFDNFYYKEVASLTGAGGWSIDLKTKNHN